MSPDITMCQDTKCPKRKKCYRFTAKPDEYRQSYFSNTPRKNSKCEYFWIASGLDRKEYK